MDSSNNSFAAKKHNHMIIVSKLEIPIIIFRYFTGNCVILMMTIELKQVDLKNLINKENFRKKVP